MNPQRLALGTAQFGFAYGIANQRGQISSDEARAILKVAKDAGINTLDTAIAYGESETRLGEIGVQGWKIITKLPSLPLGDISIHQWVQDLCLASCQRLKVKKLYGLLLHQPMALLQPQGVELYAALKELQVAGRVEKIGISIYAPEELEALWPQFAVDIVQAPFNGLDQRIVQSGWLARLKAAGVEVHARSIFLQGLLLMTPDTRPSKFARWSDLWQRLHTWLTEARVTPLQVCLGCAFHEQGFDRILVGVDSLNQLQEILATLKTDLPCWPPELVSDDIDLIHPSRWGGL
ncbi:MAG: aldo/keto reductase [Fischerella sp.]|nr:aldo/keto reductase [Fischerella sp.]